MDHDPTRDALGVARELMRLREELFEQLERGRAELLRKASALAEAERAAGPGAQEPVINDAVHRLLDDLGSAYERFNRVH